MGGVPGWFAGALAATAIRLEHIRSSASREALCPDP